MYVIEKKLDNAENRNMSLHVSVISLELRLYIPSLICVSYFHVSMVLLLTFGWV